MAVMRARQFGAKVEAAEGVAETLAAADFAANIKDVGAEHDHPEYARDLVQGSATKQPNLKGTRRLRITGTLECCGGTATAQAVWHQILRACGLARTGLVVISVGAPTGAGASAYSIGTIVGDNAARASATKTARVVRWIGGSPTRIVLEPIPGTFASADEIHAYNAAGSGEATATAST
ncbi:MAG: hypothetical protein IOD15_00365, partial [Phycisphaerales bacterium]|nr:hypothetical protein [Phycisphaerales bacterium]